METDRNVEIEDGVLKPSGYTIARRDVPQIEIFDYKSQWVEWNGHAIAFEVAPKGFPPGTDTGGAPAYQELPNQLCQCPHWGYMFKGLARVRLADGAEFDIHGGDVYHIPAGHLWWALEDFENIEFNPADRSKETIRNFRSSIAKALKEKRVVRSSDEGPARA